LEDSQPKSDITCDCLSADYNFGGHIPSNTPSLCIRIRQWFPRQQLVVMYYDALPCPMQTSYTTIRLPS